jgi:hypothetical protein
MTARNPSMPGGQLLCGPRGCAEPQRRRYGNRAGEESGDSLRFCGLRHDTANLVNCKTAIVACQARTVAGSV